jgi:hypothetical protein
MSQKESMSPPTPVVLGELDQEMADALEGAKRDIADRDGPNIWIVWHSWVTVTRPPETEEE